MTATAVDSAEITAATAPIAIMTLEISANPSIPIGFTNRMPESTRALNGPGRRTKLSSASAVPPISPRAAHRQLLLGTCPSG